MKSAATGTVSGCIVWIITFFVVSGCLLPLGFGVSSFTAHSPLAIRTVAPMICPQGTAGEVYSYETTTTDSDGFPVNATAYELHCNDASGNTVKNDPIVFGLVWDGIGIGTAVLVTAGVAFLLAAPIGVLIGRLFRPKAGAATQA